jgi:hypothetical protein
LNDIDECKNNVSERNKVLFSKAEKEKFGKMGNEKKERKKKLVYCCLESPGVDD